MALKQAHTNRTSAESEMANNNMSLDWIDALLFSFGFVGYIALLVWAQSTFGFEIPDDATGIQGGGGLGFMMGLVYLRRKVFGAPSLPAPRLGVVWGLISVLGLFSIMAGTFGWWFTSQNYSRMNEPMPDFEAEYAEFESNMTPIPADVQAFIDAGNPMVIDPQEEGESNEAYATRMAQKQIEHERQQELEQTQRLAQEEKAKQREIKRYEREWENEHEQNQASFYKGLQNSFLLTIIGAFCLRIRYPFQTN